MERTANESILKNSFPFWNELTDGDREMLIRASQSVRFSRGDNIHDGTSCTGVILIQSGALRVYMLSEDGKEVTLYRLFSGDMCILSASCVLNEITFDVRIDAEEESECVVVGGCALEDLSRRVDAVRIFSLESALGRFSDVMWVMQQILFMSMDRRLAIFLLDECAKSGSDTVRLTHEQIAKYMGTAREVISRMVKYFVSEGLISASRSEGIRILDKKRLRDLAL